MKENTAMRVQREKPTMEFGEYMPLDQLVLANTTRQDKYPRPITEDERNSFNQEIADGTIALDEKEEAKKEAAAMFRDEIKEIKLGRKVAIDAVRTGQITVNDTMHTFYDYEAGKVHEYNSQGQRILSRRIKPNELQTEIPNE
jgi:hypothetical protein